MSSFSCQHLIECISQKSKYKQSQLYIKEVQLENEQVQPMINSALTKILVGSVYSPTIKLFGLRFFKDIFLSAQFQLIDELNHAIIKHIIKTAQFDKQNKDKMKRGSSYFQIGQKRKKQNDLQKVSYSYVMFSTEIVYTMGKWYQFDQNHQPTQYAEIYQKLQKIGLPFPQNDKELKFFKIQQRQLFNKNLKQWISKLPEIQEEQSNNDDEKQNKESQTQSKILNPPIKKQTSLNDIKMNLQKSNKIISEKKDSSNQNQILLLKLQKQQQRNTKLQSRILQLEKILGEKDQQLKKINSSITSNNSNQSQNNKNLQNKILSIEQQNTNLKNELNQKNKLNQKLNIELKNQQKLSQNKLAQTNTIIQNKMKEFNQLKLKLQHANHCLQQIKLQNQNLKNKSTQKSLAIDKSNNHDKCNNHDKNQQTQKQKLLRDELQKTNKQLLTQVSTLKKKINAIERQDQNIQKQANQINIKYVQLNKSFQSERTKNKLLQQNYNKFCHEQQKIESIKDSFKRNENSMSKYLFEKSKDKQQIQQRNSKITIDHSKITTNISKIDINDINDINENKILLLSSPSTPSNTIKNKSLGKTQHSKQKIRQRQQRTMNLKTFHFSNQNYLQNERSNMNLKIKTEQNIMRNSTSYGNLTNKLTLQNNYITNSNSMSNVKFDKKSSILKLHRNDHNQQDLINKTIQNKHLVQTTIPYIQGYFPTNHYQNDPYLFKLLCLQKQKRQKLPIFINNFIQVKLLNKHQQENFYILQIMNVSYSLINIKAVICHDQFKLRGDKHRIIQPNCLVEYQIQSKVKDLNLRYPIISILGYEQSKSMNRKQLKCNIPLPLTLLQFIDFDSQAKQLNKNQLKVYKSQPFKLNKKFRSIRQCFDQINFTQNHVSHHQHIKEHMWQGSLRHKFIQNIQVFVKIIESNHHVNIEFKFRDYDQLSQNYAKVIIQLFMFLLK